MEEGVDGIAGLRKVELNVSDIKFVVVGYRCLHHIVSVELVEQSFAVLKGVLRRNHKPNLVKVCSFYHEVCDDQVPHVDGVERAEK